MKIRKAGNEDLEEIDKIYVDGVIDEIKLQYPKRTEKDILKEMNHARKERLNGWKKELKSKQSYWIVAEIGDKIIAFANAEIKNKKEGYLAMLYVDKDFRRKGIGKKLTLERINWLKKKRVKTIYAGILINNSASISNLKKLGFNPVSIKLEKKIK